VFSSEQPDGTKLHVAGTKEQWYDHQAHDRDSPCHNVGQDDGGNKVDNDGEQCACTKSGLSDQLLACGSKHTDNRPAEASERVTVLGDVLEQQRRASAFRLMPL
jgi:hypothetical protein